MAARTKQRIDPNLELIGCGQGSDESPLRPVPQRRLA